MMDFKHLTQKQILAYDADELSENESREVGRHLIKCETCRDRMPVPTLEDFRAAIMYDWEEEEDFAKAEKPKVGFSVYPVIRAFWEVNANFVRGGAAFGLILIISIMLWLNFAGNWNNGDVARSFDSESVVGAEPLRTNEFDDINKNEQPLLENTNKTVEFPETARQKQGQAKTKTSYSNKKANENNLNKRHQIAETRGVVDKCTEEKVLSIETVTEKENPVFRWKKVPGAAKYHLYISDEDEILIEEFESENETLYVLKKSLDPLKRYKWKIIVTLDNGEILAGPSGKFTIKDFQMKQTKPEKNKNSDLRCSSIG